MVVPLESIPTRVDEPTGELTWIWRMLAHASGGREQRVELLRLAAAAADRPTRLRVLSTLAVLAGEAGDLDGAAALHHEALLIAREARDAYAIANALSGLGAVAIQRGNLQLAGSLYDESVTYWQALRETACLARDLAIVGWIEAARGVADRAQAALDESLELRHRIGNLASISLGLLHQGWRAQLAGDVSAARSLLTEALTVAWKDGDPWRLAALLGVLTQPGGDATPLDHAVRLLTGVEVMGWAATWGAQPYAETPARLTARELAATWTDGRSSSIATLVEYALRCAGHRIRGTNARCALGDDRREEYPLSARELEIAALIGRGYTNRQIAEAVVIAERTAETHARNIREKLGFATRTQVAAWAASTLPRQ